MQTKRMKELTLLDMGIAMCHMALAAEELWLDLASVKRRYVKGADMEGLPICGNTLL